MKVFAFVLGSTFLFNIGHAAVDGQSKEAGFSAIQAPLCDKEPREPWARQICSVFCSMTYFPHPDGGLGAFATAESYPADYLAYLGLAALNETEKSAFVLNRILKEKNGNAQEIEKLLGEIKTLDKKNIGIKVIRSKESSYLGTSDWRESSISFQQMIYKATLLTKEERVKQLVFDRLDQIHSLDILSVEPLQFRDGSGHRKIRMKIKVEGRELTLHFFQDKNTDGETAYMSDLERTDSGGIQLLCKRRIIPVRTVTSTRRMERLSELDFIQATDSICKELQDLGYAGERDKKSFDAKVMKDLAARYKALMPLAPEGNWSEFRSSRLNSGKSPKELFSLCENINAIDSHPLFSILQNIQSVEDVKLLLELGVDPYEDLGNYRVNFFAAAFIRFGHLINAEILPSSERARLGQLFIDKKLFESSKFKNPESRLSNPVSDYIFPLTKQGNNSLTAADLAVVNQLIHSSVFKSNLYMSVDALKSATYYKDATLFNMMLANGVLMEHLGSSGNEKPYNVMDALLFEVGEMSDFDGPLDFNKRINQVEPYFKILTSRGVQPSTYKKPVPLELKHLFPAK